MNKQSVEINCNCYGPVNSGDKYFLARTRNHEDSDSHPSAHRRDYKSIEKKPQSQGKAHKKSLKKRPNSFHHTHQNSSGQINEPGKNETQARVSLQQQHHGKSKSQWAKSIETPMAGQHAPVAPFVSFKYPETTTNVRQPQYYGSHREFESVPFHSNAQGGQASFAPTRVHFQAPNSTLRPQLQQYQVQTAQPVAREQSRPSFRPEMSEKTLFPEKSRLQGTLSIKVEDKSIRPEPSKDSLYNEVSSPGYLRSHQIQRGERMLTESWAHNEDDLMIEGFDKLFLKNEENMTQSNLPSSKRNHPREVQKSKRLQNQLLIGRFAQSDGQDSDSPPSEVIGRGFDKTYQDLLPDEVEQNNLVSQTKASRSTNTRVSDMRNMNRRLSAFDNDNFVHLPAGQFKTYKFL